MSCTQARQVESIRGQGKPKAADQAIPQDSNSILQASCRLLDHDICTRQHDQWHGIEAEWLAMQDRLERNLTAATTCQAAGGAAPPV